MVPSLLLSLCDSPSRGWSPLPLVSSEQRMAGFTGGEGGQWPRSIASDATGKFLVIGIDVGGIYRSFDSGRSWEPTNVGYSPRGSGCVAIDPKNPKRVLSVGVNSSPIPQNGLYLSEDQAGSWRVVLPVDMGGDEHRDQLAFDPSSFDPKLKETRRIFWSRIAKDKPHWGPEKTLGGLFVSQDGGRGWKEAEGQKELGGKILKFCSSGRFFYAGGEEGLWKVNAATLAKQKVLEGPVTGLDASTKRPGCLWVSQAESIKFSTDFGSNWKQLNVKSLLRPGCTLRGVKASPADEKRLSVWSDQSPNGWDWPRHVSHDGGSTWFTSVKTSKGAFLPDNTRQGFTLWHPTDPKVAWSYGGDWPTRSSDGGRTFAYSGTGLNAVLVGGHWCFSRSNPDLIFFGSQDYNGAFTKDGGKTWAYTNISGNGWGGFCYGGYALNEKVFFVGDAAGWGAPRNLKTSHDEGATWTLHPLVNSGLDVATGWSRDPKRGFLGSLMTSDEAKSWKSMPECDGVLAERDGGVLYGVKRGTPWKLVESQDGGMNWSAQGDLPNDVSDMAWDGQRRRLYISADLKLWKWESRQLSEVTILKDQFGQTKVRSVALDPTDPSIVYLGSAANLYCSSVSVQRSLNGGATWTSLTLNRPLASGQKDGGREAITVRVHPKTRRLYVSTSCYGIWTYPPP